MKRTSEAAFETAIENVLLAQGYEKHDSRSFDRERAIFPEVALDFIRSTQAKTWDKLEALHGDKTGERVLEALCKWMDSHDSLATLRHGFKCFGKTLRIAFFRPAHGHNPDLEARYQANRLGLTRQLHFSPKNDKFAGSEFGQPQAGPKGERQGRRSQQSLDVTLSVNGVPVATLELKNPLSGQTLANAIHQYRNDRDPREKIFEFKKRSLVHFAVDTEEVHMATVLDFVNDPEEVREAFRQYYEGSVMGEEVDPDRLYEVKAELDESGIYLQQEVDAFAAIFFAPKKRQSPSDPKNMNALLDRAVVRFQDLQEKEEEFEVVGGASL